ncbi:hypothetical protein BH10ACT7_BH10ACT7_04810 [soil metagenome]
MSRARETVIAVVLGAMAIGATAGAAAVFAPGVTSDHIFAGHFGPDRPVSLMNKTVVDGRYLVRYSMSVYVVAGSADIALSCSLVDTSGRIANLPGLARSIPVGQWTFVEAQDVFELPDATLGIRCAPEQPTVLEVLVRNARIEATKID